MGRFTYLATLVLVVCLLSEVIGANWPTYYRGVNLTSWQKGELSSPKAAASLEQIRKTQIDCVMIVPTWYMKTERENQVNSHPARSASDEDLRKILGQARALGFRTALKPHVDCLNGAWRGFINPKNADEWFMSYGYYLIRMAKIAAEQKCDLLVIGTELKAISGKHQQKWFNLIREIKRYYSGPITYAANWDEYPHVCFWSKCDLLGVDAYFPLSEKADPTLSELIDGWSNYGGHHWLSDLESWHKRWQKPVVFTELGYTSWDFAAKEPWLYSAENRRYNGDLQARCYKATILATSKKPWLAGIFWWNWEPKPVSSAQGKMTLPPQGKPAMKVLKSWNVPYKTE